MHRALVSPFEAEIALIVRSDLQRNGVREATSRTVSRTRIDTLTLISAHAISSSFNFVTGAHPCFLIFRGMFDLIRKTAMRVVARLRLLARCVSCYLQVQRSRNELARLDYQSLRDIGLSRYDTKVIIPRPIWRYCWRSVRSCPNERCRSSKICIAECRTTFNIFL